VNSHKNAKLTAKGREEMGKRSRGKPIEIIGVELQKIRDNKNQLCVQHPEIQRFIQMAACLQHTS
jgi:hypothetical protein